MAIGDIYALRLEANLQAQLNVNVFWYRQNGVVIGTANAEDVNDAFTTLVIPAIRAALSSQWAALGLSTVNYGDPTDFHERVYIPTLAGSVAGEIVPPASCWSFRYKRLAPGQRSGWKRFSGVAEGTQQDGNAASTFVPTLNALATALQSDLVGSGGVYEPVIVKRPVLLGVNPPIFYRPTTVEFAGIGTQVSRKRPFGT